MHMTPAQKRRQESRDTTTGRYENHLSCDLCGKPAGENYYTAEECGSGDGPGFILCGKPSCARRLEGVEARHTQAAIAWHMGLRPKNRLGIKTNKDNSAALLIPDVVPLDKPYPGQVAQEAPPLALYFNLALRARRFNYLPKEYR